MKDKAIEDFWKLINSKNSLEFIQLLNSFEINHNNIFEKSFKGKIENIDPFIINYRQYMKTNSSIESFNSLLKNYKNKEIDFVFETIYFICYNCFRNCSEEEGNPLFPQINDYIIENIKKAKDISQIVEYSNTCIFKIVEDINSDFYSFQVNMKMNQCSCLELENTGILCRHLIACILFKSLPVTKIYSLVLKGYYLNMFKYIFNDNLNVIDFTKISFKKEIDRSQRFIHRKTRKKKDY